MVLSSDVRKAYLQAELKKPPIRTKRVFYRQKVHDLPVYRLDLNYLIFNQFNDRIAVEMRTREARFGDAAHDYTDEVETLICQILLADRPTRNRQTLENLRRIGQQEPGVVTLDGVIIDGNRRAMLLKYHLENNRFFEAAILEEELENDHVWIRRLETQIQFGIDEKVDYEPIAKYLKVKELLKDDMKPEEVALLFNETKADIEKYSRTMDLMDEYLEYIGSSGIYTLLRFVTKDGSREDSFLTLMATLSQLSGGSGKGNIEWAFEEEDIDDYKMIYFDYIRSECEDPKEFRQLAPAARSGGNSGGIFMNEQLFKGLIKEHKQHVTQITEELEDISVYAEKPENKSCSIEEIAKKRELDWQNSVNSENGMRQRLKRASSKREDERNEHAPKYYLKESWDKLSRITDDNLHLEEFIDDPEVMDITKKLNKRIYELKKVICD